MSSLLEIYPELRDQAQSITSDRWLPSQGTPPAGWTFSQGPLVVQGGLFTTSANAQMHFSPPWITDGPACALLVLSLFRFRHSAEANSTPNAYLGFALNEDGTNNGATAKFGCAWGDNRADGGPHWGNGVSSTSLYGNGRPPMPQLQFPYNRKGVRDIGMFICNRDIGPFKGGTFGIHINGQPCWVESAPTINVGTTLKPKANIGGSQVTCMLSGVEMLRIR